METTLETLPEALLPEIAVAGARSLRERQAATLAALASFMEQDADEHRETLRVLRKALEEDRPGQRRVFGEGAEPE